MLYRTPRPALVSPDHTVPLLSTRTTSRWPNEPLSPHAPCWPDEGPRVLHESSQSLHSAALILVPR